MGEARSDGIFVAGTSLRKGVWVFNRDRRSYSSSWKGSGVASRSQVGFKSVLTDVQLCCADRHAVPAVGLSSVWLHCDGGGVSHCALRETGPPASHFCINLGKMHWV